jgi:hypothetical protein
MLGAIADAGQFNQIAARHDDMTGKCGLQGGAGLSPQLVFLEGRQLHIGLVAWRCVVDGLRPAI